jgi:hypothetical protein
MNAGRRPAVRSADGNAVGKQARFPRCRPNEPISRRTAGPLGRQGKRWATTFPRPLPWAGRTGAPSGRRTPPGNIAATTWDPSNLWATYARLPLTFQGGGGCGSRNDNNHRRLLPTRWERSTIARARSPLPHAVSLLTASEATRLLVKPLLEFPMGDDDDGPGSRLAVGV